MGAADGSAPAGRASGALLRVEVPGVDPKDLDISVTGNQLAIRGRKTFDRKVEEANFIRRDHALTEGREGASNLSVATRRLAPIRPEANSGIPRSSSSSPGAPA